MRAREQAGHDTRPHARLPPSLIGIVAWRNSQRNVALIRKLRGTLMCMAYFIDMLSVGVCTTRHCQTSIRLVQELNVCTVHVPKMEIHAWQTCILKILNLFLA